MSLVTIDCHCVKCDLCNKYARPVPEGWDSRSKALYAAKDEGFKEVAKGNVCAECLRMAGKT